MTIAYFCIFLAFLLPYIFVALAKVKAPGMNNTSPRLALSELTGWRQRAHWAHQNALEAFAPFAASVIIASQLSNNQHQINALAITFIAARILHGGFYIANWAVSRSLAWFVGIACVISLFFIG